MRALGFYAPLERWEVLDSLESDGNFLKIDEDEMSHFVSFLEDTQVCVPRERSEPR